MNVLIACEESQEVCKAFRELGHNAFSCDILPCSGGHPEWHITNNVLNILGKNFWNNNKGWDLMIAHPICTRICNSGVWYLKKNNLWKEMEKGAEFFKRLLEADIEKICIENPIPHKYALEIIGRKYDQIIQPYNFGNDASKATCLWLKNLQKLKNTSYCQPRLVNGKKRWENQTDGGWNKLPPSKDRAKLRSKTFEGIAKAMAKQWG